MELEKIISSELKQVREDKYYMFSALKLLAPNFKFEFISWSSYRNKEGKNGPLLGWSLGWGNKREGNRE